MKLGIRWKLMFTYFLVIVIILLAVTVYLNRTLKSHYVFRTKERLQHEIALAREYILSALVEDSLTYEIDILANEIGQKLNLRVTIIDPSGIVRGDSELDGQDLMNMENHANRLEVIEAIDEAIGLRVRYSYTLNTDMMYLAMPIEREGAKLGFIRLALPLVEIQQTLLRVRRMLSFSLIIGLILALLLSYITARAVTRPLKDMSRIAKRMTRGDFSQKTVVRSRDEIGQLATTLNQMASQLDRTIKEISEERDRLRGVLGGMREGVMLTDSKGRIVLTNEAFQNIFGITSPIEGQTVIETIRDVRLHGMIEKALRNKQEIIEEIELTLQGERALYVHVVPLGIPEDLTGTVVVIYDVTQLKKLEKVRRDFVANVSHELNTPLATIKGYTETLLDKALDDRETSEKFLKVISKHADRMSKLVVDLLALSKLEAETYTSSFAPQRLHSIVANSIETLRDAIEKKTLTVNVDLAPDLPSVQADEKGLEQVMLNLLDNAVKFTPERGTITIKAKEVDKNIQVTVSDTGIGIPMKDVHRVFERFYRVNKDRSRELGGTGLGLSIVKHIVQAHGGQVWIESNVGQGSTFYFTIPRA